MRIGAFIDKYFSPLTPDREYTSQTDWGNAASPHYHQRTKLKEGHEVSIWTKRGLVLTLLITGIALLVIPILVQSRVIPNSLGEGARQAVMMVSFTSLPFLMGALFYSCTLAVVRCLGHGNDGHEYDPNYAKSS